MLDMWVGWWHNGGMKKFTIRVPDELYRAADQARRSGIDPPGISVSMSQFIATSIAERCQKLGWDPADGEPILGNYKGVRLARMDKMKSENKS